MKASRRRFPTVTYIGATGALKAVCEQVMRWSTKEAIIVVVWHEGWLWGGEKNHWNELQQALEETAKPIRLVVTFFSETPECRSGTYERQTLQALLRAIAEDASRLGRIQDKGLGAWGCISDFPHLVSASLLWNRQDDSAVLRLCRVAASLAEPRPGVRALPRPSLSEFFHFVAEPAAYRTRVLHDKTNQAKGEPREARHDLRVLKWLDVMATVNSSAEIRILLVENKPDELKTKDADIGNALTADVYPSPASPLRFMRKAKVYVVNRDFRRLLNHKERKQIRATVWEDGKPLRKRQRIPWSEVDLILQDIVLGGTGEQELTGLDLALHYFEACPQALVFLLTGLDIESLVGSGDVNWKYVDCAISKEALATLWYEYRRCFMERLGRMFWSDWLTAKPDDRRLMRHLFGSLRRWQIEPDILWHGQTLPEMIDHANRHITALWRLTNDVVGTLLENAGAASDVLTLSHRVALAVAVWMHDVGHRGDEYIAGSMDIRASHAGISERLLLRNPRAYQLGWLLEKGYLPHAACRRQEGGARLECRNQTCCSKGSNVALCRLREIGLLCRHHQSNAPLDNASLAHMARRGKEPAVYSLVADSEKKPAIEKFLAGMTNEAEQVPSPRGTAVRTLGDFITNEPKGFRCIAGLLRMLDALQIHRSRVGTSASIESFQEFLETKFGWCRSERKRLEYDRRHATEGTLAFQRATAKISELDEYEILLTTQQVHFWRQAAVQEVEVRWKWAPNGKAAIELAFILNERALADLVHLRSSPPDWSGQVKPYSLSKILTRLDGTRCKSMQADDAIQMWIRNVGDEVLVEHNSQYPKVEVRKAGYLGAIHPYAEFRVRLIGTDQVRFENPRSVFEPQSPP